MKNTHQILSKHILADGLPFTMDLKKSNKSFVVDTMGNAYLDMFSMFASSPIGYNHPYILENSKQLESVAINKLALSDIYAENYAEFLETFERVAIPKELSYAFFIDGGTLAIENALKVAFDWKTRLNLSNGINQEASQVIHFKQAFHGRSGYTLSLTNTSDPRKYQYFPKFDWPRIINPKLTFPITAENLEDTISLEKQAIAQIKEVIAKNPANIACVIIESIQGEGGDNHFRKEFFQQLRQICDEHDILLILDEVQTGIGMTGKMWCYEHYAIVPDIIAFGKKTQVCGILANREKIDRVENHVFKESSRINSTFGGNLVDMVRFKLILEVIEKENLVDNAFKLGKYLLEKIETLVTENKNLSNARGKGLFCAFDFDSSGNRDAFIKKAFENKLVILGCGEKSVRFRPHLSVTQEEIDQAFILIRQSL